MQEQETVEQVEEQGISQQDALLIIDIFKKALEYRPYLQKAIVGEDFSGLSLAEKLNETMAPRIGLCHVGDKVKIPCLFFRFVEDGTPIVEAFFFPYVAIHSFLTEARSHIRWLNLPDRTEEEKEELAVDYAIEMTLIMLDSFYRRAGLMMDSFTSEVIAQWHLNTQKNMHHYYAERGNPLPHQKYTALEEAVKDYAKSVSEFWKFQGQTYENWQKIRLAEEYEVVYKHWNRLSKMLSEKDWREYAKAGIYEDTPDDLLSKLDNTDRLENKTVETRVSELALEHAARRVRLIKKRGVSETVIKQRQIGVRVTGYASAKLFGFLKKGRELIEQGKAAQEALAQAQIPTSLEQDSESALVKESKSLEQKIKPVQLKDGESVEQNSDPAQQENA